MLIPGYNYKEKMFSSGKLSVAFGSITFFLANQISKDKGAIILSKRNVELILNTGEKLTNYWIRKQV